METGALSLLVQCACIDITLPVCPAGSGYYSKSGDDDGDVGCGLCGYRIPMNTAFQYWSTDIRHICFSQCPCIFYQDNL